MKKLIQATLILGLIYAGYKTLEVSALNLICEEQRKKLILYANKDSKLISSFKTMSCDEIKTCYIYVFEFLNYQLQPHINEPLYAKISIIKSKYNIFK